MKIERSLPWRYLQIPARVLTTVLFDLKIYGRQNIPKSGGVLIVSNHQSYLDPVLLGVRLERPLNTSPNLNCLRTPWGPGFSAQCSPPSPCVRATATSARS